MKRGRLLDLVVKARTLAVLTTGTFAVCLVATSACSSKASLVGPGGECFLATDCAPGLVCVEQANKTRVCSDDLTRVAGRPPPEGGAGDAAEEGGEGGMDAQTDSPVTPPVDSGKDTSVPVDTGSPVDTGTD